MKLIPDQKVEFTNFIDLFQTVQIRSMSEAVAESVGSMMVSHCGRGRYLQPKNFSKELYLQFNLPPLHLSDNLIERVMSKRNRQCYRKLDDSNQMSKLVSTISASNFNYRNRESQTVRLPLDSW